MPGARIRSAFEVCRFDGQPEIGEAPQQRREGHFPFLARQHRAKTEVRPVPESEVVGVSGEV